MENQLPMENGCLVCGDPTEGGSRGLCQKHYRQFKKELDSFENPEDAERFDSMVVKSGFALPLKVGGRPKSWSPFPALAEEIRSMKPMSDAAKQLKKKKDST